MSSLILHAAGVHKTYLLGQDKVYVLRGASISVHRGEFVAIMGASGSGKSTLLHLLGALDLPDRGTVTFEGQNVFGGSASERDRYRNLHFGFVFQFYHLLPELNTLENVLLPAMVRFGLLDWFKERSKLNRRAAEVLELMGLKDRFRHRPNELSGGERQRVAIGRALINEPQVLLADEPTGNLDARTGEGILGLLKALNEKGQTIVMVTHDPKVASAAHRTVNLVDGRIKALDE
ncbi:MAG TPA: ABC transporter ATP-binding protein [Phycisphaerae bacterium]|nr:ABC transporter ATP-binding protein [Phycisphaerae bacterium]HRY67091.1 ABC transporter ATP-binding protein [Phycisphaerae bacterium]HSA26540.1 ABC transporter ATP-binding protein [Phycisphaerae bacterium]